MKKTISEKTVISVIFLSTILYIIHIVSSWTMDWETDIAGSPAGAIQLSGCLLFALFSLYKINTILSFYYNLILKFFSEKPLTLTFNK